MTNLEKAMTFRGWTPDLHDGPWKNAIDFYSDYFFFVCEVCNQQFRNKQLHHSTPCPPATPENLWKLQQVLRDKGYGVHCQSKSTVVLLWQTGAGVVAEGDTLIDAAAKLWEELQK